MSTYAAAEASAYAGAPIELYRFTLGITGTWRYTSADITINHGGFDFTPAIISRGEIQGTKEDTNATVEVTLDPTLLVARQLREGTTPQPLMLTIIRRHRGLAEAQAVVIFSGEVGSIELADELMVLTCIPMQRAVQRRVPRMLYQTMCNNNLYDSICQVNPLDYTDAGTIDAVASGGRVLTVSEASAQVDGWYNGGWVQLGIQRAFIMHHIGSELTLLTPLVGAAAGTEIEMVAGCDRSHTMCEDKFNNLSNFMGFPKIPSRNPFDGLV